MFLLGAIVWIFIPAYALASLSAQSVKLEQAAIYEVLLNHRRGKPGPAVAEQLPATPAQPISADEQSIIASIIGTTSDYLVFFELNSSKVLVVPKNSIRSILLIKKSKIAGFLFLDL